MHSCLSIRLFVCFKKLDNLRNASTDYDETIKADFYSKETNSSKYHAVDAAIYKTKGQSTDKWKSYKKFRNKTFLAAPIQIDYVH